MKHHDFWLGWCYGAATGALVMCVVTTLALCGGA